VRASRLASESSSTLSLSHTLSGSLSRSLSPCCPSPRPQEDADAAYEHRLREIRSTPGVVLEDISGGLEYLPIPVINEVNDEPAPSFTYITDYKFAPYVKDLVGCGYGSTHECKRSSG
jgi:hypothetical protein